MTYPIIPSLVTVFLDRTTPEPGELAGYAALLQAYELAIPLPDRLAIISQKHRQYQTEEWQVFTPRYRPEETLAAHLTFALKYEGIELGLLKKLFETLGPQPIVEWVTQEPLGQYSRKVWFLYEWLLEELLDVPDLTTGNYLDVVDERLQYGSTSERIPTKRQRIRNNLPGVREFCPMIRKTPVLESYQQLDLSQHIKQMIGKIHPDVMGRTAAFLLLKDSKASYAIEGEKPPQTRAQRWGRALGQAGQKLLTAEELVRLQQIVIDNPRFTKMGFREQEGFIGEHDRRVGTPIPDHISARWKDLPTLMQGLLETSQKLEQDVSFDAVLAAAVVAFGFVFIHPFVDGNGRIHRYLIHHVLAAKGYVTKGLIFPVSAIILEHIETYRQVLEAFSKPRLDRIEWKPTIDHNVEVLNETVDLYRYFDATKAAEFLYECVKQTAQQTIPEEVAYLEQYDQLKSYLDDTFEMPDDLVALLVRFLEQGNGKLSERAKAKEFKALTAPEVEAIEQVFQEIFLDDQIGS